MSGQPIVAVDRVTFAYGERPAARDVSLSLRGGLITGLLGPNGSGKSTVLRLAAGLLEPLQGTVLLDGQPMRDMSRAAIARRIAVAPQDALMPDAFTGWEIAFAGRTPHLGPFRGSTRDDDAVVSRALMLVDAADLADRQVGQMSGGERQRLVLARSLAQEPDVLLLDEPTTHLDLSHQVAFLDLVLRLAHSAGIAVLIVFHDLSLAAEYCDEMTLMHEGAVVARGTPAEVMTPERVAAVYGLEVAVIHHPQSGRPVVLLPPARQSAMEPLQPPQGGPDEIVAPASRAEFPR